MREIARSHQRPALHAIFGALAVSFVLQGCATVAITGRTQLNMLSDAEIVAMGDRSFSAFMALAKKENRVVNPGESPQAAAVISNVRQVSDRIIDAAGLRGRYSWETVVIKAREPNAFVTPNGKIVVFAGLLPIAKNEAGLAAVLGHEAAHVVARHGAERASQALVQYGVLLPFSREHESEADRIGLLYMAKAGYDPAEAIALWERMAAASGGGRWEFLSTHPSPATRRDQIRAWLPEANLYYADRGRPLPANVADLQKARAEHAVRTALAPAALRPEWPSGFWYRTRLAGSPSTVTHRFTGKQACPVGECLLVEADNGAATLYTADLAIAAVKNVSGAWTKFSPPLRAMAWPLKVGDSWTENITIENAKGQNQTVPMKADVLGYEAVIVPAGSFMAFKIVVAMLGIRFIEAWYAPEARTLVRSVIYDSQGHESSSELVEHQQGN